MTAKKYSFVAKIEPANMGGAFVPFPYDVQKEFGTKGMVPVKATFEGVAYAGSLMKCGHPQHMLPVMKGIREQLGKNIGDTLKVVLWRDDAARTPEIPLQLERMMKKEGLRAFFDSLSYTHRKEYCRWIAEAKKEETREKRLEKAAAMMKAGVKTPG
ncbi:MAG TPA: YdeI/OmpD-associated family protein [Acidobacteriaceae bacterium]|nr:YdeI/OmpD-associated family protein [Acidobacteriaceae bacterium]